MDPSKELKLVGIVIFCHIATVTDCSLSVYIGMFTLMHFTVHWTNSHQTSLNKFTFAPFTLWLLKANSTMNHANYIV